MHLPLLVAAHWTAAALAVSPWRLPQQQLAVPAAPAPPPPPPENETECLTILPPKGLSDGIVEVHIPKTAGCSVVTDLMALPGAPTIYSQEICWCSAEEAHFGSLLVMLREPREHVLSQYMECQSGVDWGWDAQKRLPSFPQWVHAWAERVQSGIAGEVSSSYADDEFGCYRPVDLQCQRMTCTNLFAYPNQVNLSAALQNMEETKYVGIVDRYQESICLFEAKMLGRLSDYCNCKDPAAWGSFHASRVNHGVEEHSLSEYSEDVLREIDTITRSDRRLYEAGLERLRRELSAVEQRFGVQVFCE